jgi:ribosomal protein S18 acetylase RimI-like enzyme
VAQPQPRVAGEADLPALAETLSRAFEHDPVWGWAFEHDERERKLSALRAVFGFCAEAALGYGWVRVTAAVEAAALWIPPGLPEMSPEDEARMPGLIAEVCAPESTERVMALMEGFSRTHPTEPPHFYLSLLGTHPDQAGHGFGVGLVAANLEEIDAADALAYLESSNDGNIPRYESLGFRPLPRIELVPGIPATQMWREPA